MMILLAPLLSVRPARFLAPVAQPSSPTCDHIDKKLGWTESIRSEGLAVGTHTVESVLTDTGVSGKNSVFRRLERRIDYCAGTQGWCCDWTRANSAVACQWPIVMRYRQWVSLTPMLSLLLSTVTVIRSSLSRTYPTARANISFCRVDPSRRMSLLLVRAPPVPHTLDTTASNTETRHRPTPVAILDYRLAEGRSHEVISVPNRAGS